MGLYAIAEALTRDGLPCPSAHDWGRNGHRSGVAWSKSAVRAILTQPRYTGYQVWNRQRTDEVLLDVNDVGLGHASVQWWNPASKWVTSAQITHEPLVDRETFDRAQALFPTRGQRATRPSRAQRPYIFKGLVHCDVCERKMQGQYSHGAAYYRCRFPLDYALANDNAHPRNVYLREEALVEPLDAWLASAFDGSARAATVDALHAAQDGDNHETGTRIKIAELDTRLARYKATLDAGGDPAIVAGWIATTRAERAQLQNQLELRTVPTRMTKREIRDVVDQLGDIVARLRNADPNDKAEVYHHLGLYLRFDPHQNRVRAEARIRGANDGVGGATRAKTQRGPFLSGTVAPDWAIAAQV